MSTIRRKVIPFVILIGFSCGFISCSTYTVKAVQTPKTDDIYSECVVSWLWGLQDPQINAPCEGQGMEVVAVQTNWLYSLCTVATLGIVSPSVVKYRCAGIPLINGDPMGYNSAGAQK